MNGQVKVREIMSRKSGYSSLIPKGFASIVAYPQNSARDVATIMTDINIDCLPVLSSPWKKKLIGVVELSKIRVLLNE